MISGIFETGLTNNDISVLKNYANQVHTLGARLKNGNITQERYSSNLARLKNEFTGVTTSAQATAIKIDLLEAEFADGKIGIAEYQAKMKVLEGEMQTTSVLAEVMGTALRTAFNVVLMIVINLIITGIMEMTQAEEKAIENSKEIANKAKEEATALDNLRKSYFDTKEAVKNNTKTKEDLTEITDTLLKRLGVELDTVEDLTTEYGNLDNAINQITADNIINDILPGMAEGIVAARKELLDTASKDLGFSESNDAVIKYLEKWNEEHGNPFYYGGKYYGKENFNFNNRQTKNVHALDYNETDALNAITEDIKVYTQLLSDMNKKNLEGSDAYSQVNNRLKLLKEQYRALTTAISENNDKTAEAVFLRGNALNKGLPKTFEAYEKYRENIIKLAQSDEFVNLFKGTAEDIETSIAKQLSSNELISAYEQRFQDIQSLTQKAITKNISSDDVKKYLFSLTDDELEIVKQIPDIFEQGLDGITQKIQEWKNRPENQITYELGNFNEKFTGLKETIDSTLSNQSTIQSAFDKIREGTSLTSDEVVKLTNLYPELLGKFTKTADGWTIGTDLLVEANKSVIESAKTAIEAEKALLQGKIDELKDKLNFENIESLNPDLSKIQALTDELNKAEQEMSGWDNLLKILGLDVSDTKEKINAFDKAIEDSTKSISLIKTAMEEMSNDGHISASTYQALVEKGEDYVACLELVDGKLTLNITKLKELEVQELRNIISKNNLRISELEAQKAHGGTAEVIDKETQALARQNAVLEQQIQDVWSTTGDSGSGSSSDPTKDAYTEKQKELKHLLEMEKITQKQYYEMLFGSDEYKALLANRTKYFDELNSLDEEYYKYQQNLYKENADKQFDDLEDQYKRGIITAEQYAQGLHDLGQELYGEDSIYGGTEFAIKALEELDKKVKETSEDIYDESLDSLKKNNDGTLKSEEQFIKDWTKLNDDTWKTINPKQWEENYNEIADCTKDFYKQLLDDGVLDVNQYTHKVNVFFNQLKGLGIDLGEGWLADALNDTKDIDFDRLKEKLSADGDTDINDVIADVDKLAKKDIKLFSDTPETLKKNGEEIFNSLVSSAQDALSKGLISPERYLEIIDTFADTWQEKLGLTQGVIDEAKNALEVDDWMDDWDKTHNYNEDKDKNNFELRQDRIEATRKAIIDTYGVDGVKNVKAYTDAIKDADEQQKQLNEDIYAKTKDDLSADGDRIFDDVLSDAEELSKINIDFFSDDEDTLKKNAEDIFSSVVESAQDSLERGLISPERFKEIIDKYGVGIDAGDIQDAYDKGFDSFVDDAKDKLDKMLISPDEYYALIDEWGDKLNIAEDIIQKAKDAEKDTDYDSLKRDLTNVGDELYDDILNDAENLYIKNAELYKEADPSKFISNNADIFKSVTDAAKDALDKMLISPEEYLDVITEWGNKLDQSEAVIREAKESLSLGDRLDAWDNDNHYDEDNDKENFALRQKRIDDYRKAIIDTYGIDGVNNVKAYTDAMKEANEQQQKLNEDIYAKTKEHLSSDGNKTLFNTLSDAKDLWNETLSLFAGNDEIIKSNAKDIFGTVSSALEDALKKGIITPDEYEAQLRSWGDTLQMTEADITDALVDTYEYRADALQKINDGSLDSERKYIADMKSLNFSTYGDENSDFYDLTTFASNLRDITDHELDVLGEAYKKGEISTREYAEEVTKILGDNDVLGSDYIAEKQEEIDKIRAEREKSYWEQQKELVEDYYDKQIEELEKVQDEQEKITKAEELRLNLVKARKTLEDARNNKNQLIFHDGIFEYMADQDAIMSAEEEVAEAVKAIKDNELQEQIDLLKSQKDEAVSFYDDMISMIEAYINETVNISESDSETLKKIAESQYSKDWKDVRYGDKTANEVTEEQKKAVGKSENKSDTKPNSNDKVTVKADSVEVNTDSNSSTDIQSNDSSETDHTALTDTVSSIATTTKEIGDSLSAFINNFNNGSAFENLVRALGGNPTAEAVKNFQDSYNATLVGKQIVPSTLPSNVTNNSSTTNNATKVINLGGISVKLELTVESLDDFVNNKIDTAVIKLGNAIESEMSKILVKA